MPAIPMRFPAASVQARESFAKVLPAEHKVFAAIEASLKGL
jgi:hypothetical protein